MRILLIEDDEDASSAIRCGLKERYTVDCAFTGREALTLAEACPYEIYIVDINLPDLSGLDVCRQLRKLNPNVSIIMLTASTELADKVTALDSGADDFLSKPFQPEELYARLRALQRRGTFQTNQSILVGDEVKIDLTQGVAYHHGVVLNLRRKEFLILEYFLRHVGQVITRNILLEHVWESKSDPLTNTVDVHIKCLRDKVDKPFETHHIRTIHGLGYKFETAEEVR